jgi:hypothetical protein
MDGMQALPSFPPTPPRLLVDPTRPTFSYSLAPARRPVPVPSQTVQNIILFSAADVTLEDVGPVTYGRRVAKSRDKKRGT